VSRSLHKKPSPPSLNPEPWAGSIVVADNVGIGVRCSQEKWNKAKELISSLIRLGDKIDWTELDKIRGFMVHSANLPRYHAVFERVSIAGDMTRIRTGGNCCTQGLMDTGMRPLRLGHHFIQRLVFTQTSRS
jgi:hypothetical protein